MLFHRDYGRSEEIYPPVNVCRLCEQPLPFARGNVCDVCLIESASLDDLFSYALENETSFIEWTREDMPCESDSLYLFAQSDLSGFADFMHTRKGGVR